MITTIRCARLTLALAAAFALASVARSQTYTWIGTTAGNWSNAANWSGGVVPVSGPTTNLIFNSSLDVGYTATNDIAAPFVAQSITVNNTSSGNSPFGVLLVGPIQMNGANVGLINNGPGDLYIGPLSGTVSTWDLEAPTTITGTNAGQLRITDQITGSGSLTINRPTTNLANGFTLLFYMNATGANTFTGGVTLQAGNLSIGGQARTNSTPANLGTGTLMIATTGSGLTATGDIRANAGQPVIVTVPVTINSGSTLEQFRGTQIVFGTPVTGLGAVSVGTAFWAPSATTSALAFEGANTYAGPTDLTNSTIIVRGTNGALTGTSQITLNRNSALTLDSTSINADTGNTAGNQTSQDRIPDSTPLIYHQGALNMIANASASTTETVGTLTGDGWNTFNLTPQTATGVTLTINNLVRSNHGTFDVRGASLGANAAGSALSADVVLAQLNGLAPTAALAGGGGVDGSTNLSIIPFMTGSGAAGTAGNTFVTYDTNGLRLLSTATEFVTALAPGSTNNVRTTVPLVVAGQPATANSLIVGAASAGLFGFGGLTGQATIASGAVLTTSATSYLNVGTLNFGGAEAIITANGTTNINSAIANASGLTYSGTARAGLLSPNNAISGPISINSGNLTVNNQAQLGGASSINFNGGALTVSNLGTAAADVLSTPIAVGPAGGIINVVPVSGTITSTSQVVTLTGALTGSGPLLINATGALTNGFLVQGGGGTVVLAGDASGYSGVIAVNGGVLQFDSDARLGSNPLLALSSAANISQPAALHVTATTATSKNLIVGGLGIIQVDAGATYTINGYISSMASGSVRKFGAGNLILTGQETYNAQTFIGSPAMTGNINVTSGVAGSFSGIGGTLTLSGQGAILDSIATTIAPGGTLVLDNTGTNLTNRLSAYVVNMAGGSLVLMGNSSAASSEITGPMTLAANTGSFVQVVPGAGQTAALYFSGAVTGGFVRANTTGNGSTVTFNAPGLGGTTAGAGQINFVPDSPTATLPTLVGGGGAAGTPQISIFPAAFGEDPSASAIGLVTGTVVPANPTTGFPSYYSTRLLNPTTEYVVNAFPDSGTVTTNHRQTTAAAPAGSPTINALFLDTGGSLTIANGNTVTLTSGTLVMAGGTSITGGILAAATDSDLSLYVGPGTATLGSDVATSSSALPAITRTLAKTGPGTLVLTSVIGGAAGSPPGTIAIQRGTLRLGAGSILPPTINVSVDAGATFDLNSPGATVTINRLVGLGTVQLGSAAGTDLQVTVPSTAPSTAVFGGTILGAGTIEKVGPGTLEFGSTANYAGPITLTAGTLQFGDPSGFAPNIPSVAGSAITAADGTTITYSAVQNFARPININVGTTSGTVNLTGNQNSTTQISGLITLASGKTLNITTSAGGLYNFAGAIVGVGNVTWNAGLDIISGANTYVGNTSVANAAAILGIGSDSAFGNGTITVSAAASFFAAGANHTVSNPINLNSDITFGTTNPIYQGYNLTFGGPVTLSANRIITTTAAGVLTLTSVGGGFNLTKAGGGTLALAGANDTYSGTTTVNAGTLLVNGTLSAGGGIVSVASGAFLGGSGTLNRDVTLVAGATVSANGNNFTIGSLTGTAGTVNDNSTAPGTVTVGTDNTSTSFGGTIVDGWTGSLALAKVGTGVLTLTGTNTYSGGTTISGGTLSVTNDASLGAGPVTVGAFGTLNYSTTTSTTRSFPLAGGTVSVSAGQTLTLNGGQVSGGYLAGPGTFATGAVGAQFANMTIRPAATLTSNSGSDLFLNVSNGGALNVAAGLASPVTFTGFTNQGSGTITIGAASSVNVSDFQSYGTLTLNPATVGAVPFQTTEIVNTGTSPLSFNGGSRTFLGTPATAGPPTAPNFVAGIDLKGQNLTVAGGLFVNNGYVLDSTTSGPMGTIIVDFGALYKGAGYTGVSVVTQNGGKVQAGNSPGAAAYGKFVFGPGGVSNYVFAIDDATGTAGPSPDAAGHVSGWGLIDAVRLTIGGATSSGDFAWTATPSAKLTVSLDTLVNPTTVGTDVAGPMADFDPSHAYSWPATRWSGTYSGPTDVAALDAATSFDTSGFLNPVSGTFGWSLDAASQTLSLTYTPSAVPEPGSLALAGLAAAGFAAWRRRRRGAR
jgi:fibronectin-binding autotransporter adhesin